MRIADLTGKVAVVTGGSRRIGRAVSLRLAQDGAAVNYRADRAAADAVAAELTGEGRRAAAIRADGSDPEQTGVLMDQAAAALGGLVGFLVSPEAGHLTGRTIPGDGGFC